MPDHADDEAAPKLFLGVLHSIPFGARDGKLVPFDPDEFGVIVIDSPAPIGE